MSLKDLIFRLVFPEQWRRAQKGTRRPVEDRTSRGSGRVADREGTDSRYFIRRRR